MDENNVNSYWKKVGRKPVILEIILRIKVNFPTHYAITKWVISITIQNLNIFTAKRWKLASLKNAQLK